MLWLCLSLPRLPASALDLRDGVVSEQRGSQRWLITDAPGVAAGMTLAAALAVQPDLAVHARKPSAEQETLRHLAHWLYHYGSPVTCQILDLQEPFRVPRARLWFEVGASLQLFGGLAPLRSRLLGELNEMRHVARCAVAPTRAGAALLAECGREITCADPAGLQAALADLPIAALPWPGAILAALKGVGLRRIGVLLDLPRESFARRFGEDLLMDLDRLRGLAAEPLDPVVPPSRYARRFELSGDVESVEPLLFPLKRMCTELGAYLRARDSGALSLHLVCLHAFGAPTRLTLRLLGPTRDAARMFAAWNERLLREPPDRPVTGDHARGRRVRHTGALAGGLVRQARRPAARLAAGAGARAGAPGRAGAVDADGHRRSSAGACSCPGHTRRNVQLVAGAAPALAPQAAARDPGSAADRAARAHRKRLVGRRRRCARLLPDRARRQLRLGLPRSQDGRVVPARVLGMSAGYAELHCLSNFSFLRGASHADELVAQAKALGYAALAITDECSMAGVVRAHEATKKIGLPLIIGAEFQLADGPKLVLLAENHDGYSGICGLITRARRRSVKGAYRLLRADLGAMPGCSVLWIADAASLTDAQWVRQTFGEHAWIAVELHRDGDDAGKLARLQDIGRRFGLPLVAAGDVHMHARARRALQDTLTAIRHGVPVAECGARLFANGERHLRSVEDLRTLYPTALLQETLAIAERCRFNLSELKYDYPHELVPHGETPASHLAKLTEAGVRHRWPDGESPYVRSLIDKELKLITRLGYEHFFLTVHDVVAEAKRRGILCQGRGSAANSAVCYALGITEVRPDQETRLVVERFISAERNEPPDIDVDFEHQRREEIIQYVYAKYGRERTAIAATVISYRSRSAVRDVGKALGFSAEEIDRLSKSLAWWDEVETLPKRLAETGFDPSTPRMRALLVLVRQILGFPRHLSQHVGGFVISDQPLSQLVPIENAAMPDRTIIQWDKDDLESLGLLKVDVLALGMLTALKHSVEMVSRWHGAPFSLADIPREDRRTYEMIQRAETIGVFQIESRAQMSMLPRLKPAKFYDLVIQIAIVRPGPIQGDMVHPYLRRRNGEEQPVYPDPDLEQVLKRTLGVPLFQEQVMEIAVVAAGFSPGEADQMRRSMAAWKKGGGFDHLHQKLIDGMRAKGYSQAFADSIYAMIQGFASYGFPESHSASFALLAYFSAWLKCHRPAAFFAGLLNSQPMGFYPPTMLVGEARRMGVDVRSVDVTVSCWGATLEPDARGAPAIRLGFNLVSGFNEAAASRIVAARAQQSFDDAGDLARRARLSKRELDLLAQADALQALAGHRHAARWAALGHERAPELLADAPRQEFDVRLPAPSEGQEILSDYRSTRLTLRRHPVSLLRDRLDRLGVVRNAETRGLQDKQRLSVCGLVMFRQRPQTAKGVMFMTLEDETGIVNLVVWAKLLEEQRAAAIGGSFLVVEGELQKQEEVIHVVARRFHDHSDWIGELPYLSRDFR